MKKLLGFIYSLLSILVIIVFSIAIFAFIQWLQAELFVPKNYLMWVVKPPASRLVFIYEIYLFFAYFYLFRKDFREAFLSFFKRNGNLFLVIFPIVNVVLIYAILANVTVLTKSRIFDYSFFTPNGTQYQYNDIVKVNTGLYGQRTFFGHSKGDFFYIIELKDGKKVDLAKEIGAVKHDIDERFMLDKIDKTLVKMGIPKKSSLANFKYATKSLDKIYTDKMFSNRLLLFAY